MKRSFDDILNNLKKTIATYNYFTDFEKVFKNANKYNVEINILNSLIGAKQIEEDFLYIINKYPETLKVIPLLLAIRKQELVVLDGEEKVFNFSNTGINKEMFVTLMRKTGLFDLLENSIIKDLKDYITGVEVGLDSNARKNRTGKAMEDIVEGYLMKVAGIKYSKELNKGDISKMYGVNLDDLLTSNGQKDADKRFDFVVESQGKLYLIETNFYGSSGSKLNETARSFKGLANDLNKLQNIHFIWITDGIGWLSAKNNLKETYDVMDNLFTLSDLENGVLEKIFK